MVMFLIRSQAFHVRACMRAYACAQSILPQEKLLSVPDSFYLLRMILMLIGLTLSGQK